MITKLDFVYCRLVVCSNIKSFHKSLIVSLSAGHYTSVSVNKQHSYWSTLLCGWEGNRGPDGK